MATKVGEKKVKQKKPGRMRRITVRVGEMIDCEKQDFYSVVHRTLDLSSQIENGSYTELRTRDALQPGTRLEVPYIYPAMKQLNTGGFSLQLATITSGCTKKYLRERWQYINRKRSVPNSENPVWPLLHNGKNRTMRLVDAGEYLTCSVLLIDGWYTFKIRSGSNYRDQIRALRFAMKNNLVRDSQLRCKKGDPAVLDISVLLPEVKKKEGIKVSVCTAHHCVLQVCAPRSIIPWIVCSVGYREKKAGYDRQMYKYRSARKKGEDRRIMAEKIEAVRTKSENFTKNYVHVWSSKVIEHCVRIGVGVIEYDDVVKSAFKSFPWHAIKLALQYKAEDAGIAFRVVKHGAADTLMDLEKPHAYFIYDPVSHRIKIGRSENFQRRLKTFLTSNPDWVCLAIENCKKGEEVALEKRYLARFDSERLVDRGCSGHEVRQAGPVLEFLREAGWLGNTGNRSQLMQVPSLEKFMDGVGRLQADGDDETGDIAG